MTHSPRVRARYTRTVTADETGGARVTAVICRWSHPADTVASHGAERGDRRAWQRSLIRSEERTVVSRVRVLEGKPAVFVGTPTPIGRLALAR
jgi:anti-sigma factor RsiW